MAVGVYVRWNCFSKAMKRVSISETTLGTGEEAAIYDEFYRSRGGFAEIRSQQKRKFKKLPAAAPAAPDPRLKSALKKPKTPGLGIGGGVHLPPLHVDDINGVSDIIHRVTLQSGGYCSSFTFLFSTKFSQELNQAHLV
jgi:hypothetical protein